MAPFGSSPVAASHFPTWQRDYEAVLSETDTSALFKCVEIAEAAILTRRDALKSSAEQHSEGRALEEALANLGVITKRTIEVPVDALLQS